MRTAIFGNSNSILVDGWLPAFKRTAPAIEAVNLSLGGSRSPAMLYQILNNASALQDVNSAIIEPTVLDCGEIAGTGDDVAGQAHALLATLQAKSIMPTVLALPRFPRHVDTPSPGMVAWAGIAASLGFAVFDGAFVIRQMAACLGKPNEHFWRDAHGHHSPAAGKLIGILLARSFAQRQGAKMPAEVTSTISGWRILSGAQLGADNKLPVRHSSSALMSVDCVVLRAGDAVNCALTAEEKILGIAINYGEMEPRKDVIIEVVGAAGSRQINVCHPLLPEMVTHKASVLFRATNFPKGSGILSLKICPENARFAPDLDQRMDLSGVLVGREIPPKSGWETSGLAALAASHDGIMSGITDLMTTQPDLFK